MTAEEMRMRVLDLALVWARIEQQNGHNVSPEDIENWALRGWEFASTGEFPDGD